LGLDLAATVGASGSVFGVMIAFAMFFPDRYIYLYFLIPVKAKYLVAFLVVIEFLSVGNMSFVAHLAHIGGAISGFIFFMVDKRKNLNFDRLFRVFDKSPKRNRNQNNFRKPFGYSNSPSVEDAEFSEITTNNSDSEEVLQEEIDRILDKISQSGYNNLTDREKQILFNASKKK